MFGKCLFFAIYLFGKCQFPTFYLFGKFYFVIFTAEIQDFTRHSANGLPLGSEADNSYRKILFFDCGLMLRLLGITIGDTTLLTTQILTATAADLVNKGTVAELVAGLEMLHYMEPNLRHELFCISPIQRPHYITSSYTYQFLKNILDRFRIQDC